MSNYSLYFHPSLVAPTLLKGNIHQKGEQKGKIFLVGAAQTDFPEGFPKNIDPHWFPYPKIEWYPGINLANENLVWTQIEADSNHYLRYIPTGRDEEIIAYKDLLRKSLMGPGVNYSDLLRTQQRNDAALVRKMKREQQALERLEEQRTLEEKRKQAVSSRANRAAKRLGPSFGKKR